MRRAGTIRRDHDPAFSRRGFLQTAVAASAVSALIPAGMAQGAEPVASDVLLDTNVSLGQWPFRHHLLDDVAELASRLRAAGVTEAWVGSYDALLHKDISSVNARLASRCATDSRGLFLPFGCLNLLSPGWEEDLRQCHELHRMKGIRLHPGPHGYGLDVPEFARLLELAGRRRLIVQICCGIEDERTQHPRFRYPAVDLSPLLALLEQSIASRVQLLNAFRTLRGKQVLDLAARGVRFEIATLEGVEAIGTLLPQLPAGGLCFGSNAPFFYFESAVLKMRESVLTPVRRQGLAAGNARDFARWV